MIVKIDKLSHDFKGITRIDDKVTFVSDTVPGEVVDIKIINEKKKINEGKVIAYIETSDDRISEVCPYSDKCGGCDIAYMKYSKQIQYKKEIVCDIMKKYAGISVNPQIIFDNNIYGYRNKITLRVFDGKLSLIENGSNILINIDKCLLVNNTINKIINLINEIDLTGVNEVIIKGTKEIMVIVSGDLDSDKLIDKLKLDVDSIILNDKVIYGNDYIIISIGNFNYAIYPKSFFQINTNMIDKLYDKIHDYAGIGNSLLDLYCGAGTIGIYLADNFEMVRGIEINEDAVNSANLNKKINGIKNISFECKNVNQISKIDVDVVVVDPPRGGLDKITINKLLDGNCKKIVYVSCNPITLARDIKLLKDKYNFEDITLFDMFPNTKHVESVTVLHRNNFE